MCKRRGKRNKTDTILIVILTSLRSLHCTLHINANLQNILSSRCTSYFQFQKVIITRVITQFSSIARGCLFISQAFISIHSHNEGSRNNQEKVGEKYAVRSGHKIITVGNKVKLMSLNLVESCLLSRGRGHLRFFSSTDCSMNVEAIFPSSKI